jgi:hypothetical protein
MYEAKNLQYGDNLVKELLLIRDGWKCFYCGHLFSVNMDGWNNMTIDHVEPQSLAKDDNVHNISNLRISCRNCNSSKSDKEYTGKDIDFFRKRRAVARQRDEKYINDRFQFIIETTDGREQKEIFEEVLKNWSNNLCIENLMVDFKKALNLNDMDIKVKPHKNGDYLDFKAYGRDWTYTPANFVLQPHFIHVYDVSGKVLSDLINEVLEAMGYLKGADYRGKYLKPFFSIQEGIEIIKNEILLVHRIWDAAGLQ